MQKTNKIAVLLLAIPLIFTSCKKEENKTVVTENYKGTLIVNEGGFGKSNGSIGLYKPGSDTYVDAYQTANGIPLGDVVQSISAINNSFYIVVNGSNKIEVVNQSNFKNTATIMASSPRYVHKINSKKAYISHLYKNEVSVLNLETNKIDATIDIKHWSEHFGQIDSIIYIGTNSTKVMMINANTDQVIDSIEIGKGLGKIQQLSTTKIAILSTGETDFGSGAVLVNGKVVIVSNTPAKIVSTVNLSSGSYGGAMCYNSGSEKTYVALGGSVIYEISGTTATDWTTLTGTSIYGLGLDNATGNIYVTDAKDYSSNGTVSIINSSKAIIKTLTAGIIPNAVLFNN